MSALSILDSVLKVDEDKDVFMCASALDIPEDNKILRFLKQKNTGLSIEKRDKMLRELCLYTLYRRLYPSVNICEFYFTDIEEYIWEANERNNVLRELERAVKEYPGFLIREDVYGAPEEDLNLWYSVVPIDMRLGKSKREAVCDFFELGG